MTASGTVGERQQGIEVGVAPDVGAALQRERVGGVRLQLDGVGACVGRGLDGLEGDVTTLSVIWNFHVFTQVWTLRFGKPERDFQTLATYAYSQAFQNGKYGLGSAVSIITVLLILGVMAFYVRQMFKIGDQD